MAAKDDGTLTPREEVFVQARVKGMSQRQAYRVAFPESKAKDTTVDSKASEMWKKAKVQARYKECVEEAKGKSIWTREMAIDDLKWLKDKAREAIEQDGVRQATGNALLNAVKELNAIENIYEEKRLQMELLEARIAQIKTGEKDTSLLEALLEVAKDT